MQLMQWLPGKWRAMDSSSAAWKPAASRGPPPQRLPIMPTPAWQSTFTPVMPAPGNWIVAIGMLARPSIILLAGNSEFLRNNKALMC